MKKITNKILLISIFTVCILNIKSFGASEFSYTIDKNDNATITAYNGTESNLTIPSTIDGHNVVTIESHAFDESRNSTNGHTIKNLIISEGITNIGGWAFCKCENLESVKLPESLQSLDWQVFLGCKNLTKINIPKNLTTMSNGFLEQTAIEEITIPKNIQKFIGNEFRLCKNLKKVFIYNDSIEYYNGGFDTDIFNGCSSNLVLYANEGSTTQKYAQEKGIQFKTLSSNQEPSTIVSSIKLNKKELSLKEGESETLIVNFIEISSSTQVRWSSSNEKIATVENGKVTAKRIGSAIITVSDEDGKYKDTCNIVITRKENNSSENNINNKEDNTSKNNSDNTKDDTLSSEDNSDNTLNDNTTANVKLPNTGINIIIISMITIILITITMYKKYNNYKDI